jgi:hypothetical protein
MDDEVLTGLAALIGMVDAGVDERLLHTGAVDPRGGVGGVLLDNREDVGEQAALGFGELGVLDRRLNRRALQPVDRRP